MLRSLLILLIDLVVYQFCYQFLRMFKETDVPTLVLKPQHVNDISPSVSTAVSVCRCIAECQNKCIVLCWMLCCWFVLALIRELIVEKHVSDILTNFEPVLRLNWFSVFISVLYCSTIISGSPSLVDLPSFWWHPYLFSSVFLKMQSENTGILKNTVKRYNPLSSEPRF